MKILFLSDNFPPELNAPATRTFEHCREWVRLGADVTVLTCAPNFPQGKVYRGYKNSLFTKETVEGVKVVRVWSYITANEGFFKRIVDYMSFALSSFIAGLFIETDIIIATSPQFFTTWSAWLLSQVKRRPWVFEVRDLWPESVKAVGAMKNDKILRLFEKIELFLYKNCKMVVAGTEAFKENLVSRGIMKDKIMVVPNGVMPEVFYPREKDKGLLSFLNLNGKFIVGYIGTHGMAHGLELIAGWIGKISDDDIHFVFVGDGACKRKIIETAKGRNTRNLTILDPVSKDQVPVYLSIMDAALVPLRKADVFKTVLPSKIFEASAMGKPIILGVDGYARELIERYGAGLCFEPENETDFLEKLFLIKKDRVLHQRLKDGCMTLTSDFDRKRLAEQMYGYIEEAANGR